MPRQLPFRNLLVLVDGTDTSFRAVDLAISLAGALRAQLTALALVETETLRQLLSVKILSPAEMDDLEEGLMASARRQITEARTQARKEGLEINDRIFRGNSEVVLPQAVRELGIDLIVLGFFDSRHVQRDLLARQRQQVVDHAPCPVLVAR